MEQRRKRRDCKTFKQWCLHVEATNYHGETALFIAARRGDLEVTRSLLDFEAKV